MMKSHFLAAAMGISLCAAASAEYVVPLKDQPLYWGVSYTWADYTEESLDDDAATGAITGRLGYQFSPIMSAEARYSRGVRSDDFGGVDVEIDHMYGVYGKFNLLTDINLTPYAILGYTQGEAKGFANGAGSSNDDSGLSYGIGVDLCREQPVCLNAEYISYLSEDSFDVSAFAIGLKVVF